MNPNCPQGLKKEFYKAVYELIPKIDEVKKSSNEILEN